MKRIISFVLVLFMLWAAFPFVNINSGAETYGYLLCDADDDNDITMKDVLLVRKYVAGIIDEKSIDIKGADADIDGDITLKDVLIVRKVVAGVLSVDGNNTNKRYRVDTITIADKNISRYTIVIPEGNKNMEFAASELKKYVNDACGIALNVTNDPESVEGHAIRYRFDTDDEYALGKEGFKVSVAEDGDLDVVCGSMRGPMYSAYYILKLFGYRFFLNQMIFIFPAENVNIPKGYDETEVPELAFREESMRGIKNVVSIRNGLNGLDLKDGDMEAYGGRIGTLIIHAHSFEYQCGIGPYENPCFTSEDTYNKVINYNYKLIEEQEAMGRRLGIHYTQLPCSPNDTEQFCDCPNCKRVYIAEGSIAGATIRLANRVAEKMCADFPGLEIYTLSYINFRIPPKMTRPNENVVIMFCAAGCNNHTFDHPEECAASGGNQRHWTKDVNEEKLYDNNNNELEWFDEWRALTDNIQLWYYGATFNIAIAPSPNIFNLYYDFREMASRGINGIYCEGGPCPYASFEFLRGYLAAQLMWNPYMSEEEYQGHIKDFMIANYGDGWEYVMEYLYMSNEAADLQGCWTNNFDRPWNMYNKEYFLNNYKYMIQLFDKAKEMTNDETEKYKITLCSLQCEFLGLSATYERDYVNGDDESRAEYAKHYAYLMDMVDYYEVRVTTYVSNRVGCLNFPKDKNDIRDPMTWIAPGFDGEWHYSAAEDRWI